MPALEAVSMSNELNARMMDLEMTITHLQKDYEQLNQVVIEQQALIEFLQKRTETLETGFEQIRSENEKRDPAQERPPHY